MLTAVYERRLARALEGAPVPRHVGVIMDGNRRWARSIGLEDVAHGHRRGADKIVDLLSWCDDAGVAVVTLFMLSTDNLRRPETELSALMTIIEDVAVDLSRPGRRWQVRPMGAPEVVGGEHEERDHRDARVLAPAEQVDDLVRAAAVPVGDVLETDGPRPAPVPVHDHTDVTGDVGTLEGPGEPPLVDLDDHLADVTAGPHAVTLGPCPLTRRERRRTRSEACPTTPGQAHRPFRMTANLRLRNLGAWVLLRRNANRSG